MEGKKEAGEYEKKKEKEKQSNTSINMVNSLHIPIKKCKYQGLSALLSVHIPI